MLKNYILTSFRQFSRYKIFTTLNVIGLSTGMMVFLLIMIYVNFEFSFDKYHTNSDRIYRILQEQKDNYYMGTNKFAVSPAPLAPALKSEYPEVEFSTRISLMTSVQLKINDKVQIAGSIYSVDPDFFKIFTLEFIQGDPETVFKGAYNTALSESEAKKLFGNEDPMGKTFAYRDTIDFVVTGVYKDMPANSHFRVDIAIPYLTYMQISKRDLEHWNNNSFFTYFLLSEGTDHKAFEAKLPLLRDKYTDDKLDKEGGQENIYRVQPLSDIYLFTDANFSLGDENNGVVLYIFSSIAFIILLIACINYMNMATAMASSRAKEVGVRKVVGAAQSSLVKQFLSESVFLAIISLALAMLLVWLLLPTYNTFLNRELSFNVINNPSVLWLVIGSAIGVALVSGSYPAFVISSYKPSAVLKGRFATSSKGVSLRNILVVAQFTISGTLILCTLIVKDQLNFIQDKDMGFDREKIISVLMRDPQLRKDADAVTLELMQKPFVVDVTRSTSMPNNTTSSTTPNWIGKVEENNINIYIGMIDESFLNVFNIKLKEGRNVSIEDRTGNRGAFLLNETAVREIGWENPLEESLIWNGDTVPVVGILKDFHQHSLHLNIEPLMYYTGPNTWGGSYISIKIAGDNTEESIAGIEEIITKYSGNYPFDYQFFDDMFAESYDQERKVSQIINVFTLLTILIACLGLYGLALFAAKQRIKEVSIRKVLGASLMRIVLLLNRNFSILILTAFVTASIISYYIMNQWLENFAFHVNINPLTFIGTLLLMTFIGWLTVGYQTFKAANANPVDTLKEE